MDIMQKIRSWQLKARVLLHRATHRLAKHKPELLYIGCIDARLDPINDIGIKLGSALIHRTIAAIVSGVDVHGYPINVSEAATVEFAVNVMKVKHIVVAAHTHCGGLQAYLDGCSTKKTRYLKKYLQPLKSLKKEPSALEESSVRMSLENLMTYPFIKKAVEQRRLALHGWVIDTATKRISEVCDINN